MGRGLLRYLCGFMTLIALCHTVLQIEGIGGEWGYGLPEADSKAMAENQNGTPMADLHREN